MSATLTQERSTPVVVAETIAGVGTLGSLGNSKGTADRTVLGGLDLAKNFAGNVVAVDGLSFSMRAGEVRFQAPPLAIGQVAGVW